MVDLLSKREAEVNEARKKTAVLGERAVNSNNKAETEARLNAALAELEAETSERRKLQETIAEMEKTKERERTNMEEVARQCREDLEKEKEKFKVRLRFGNCSVMVLNFVISGFDLGPGSGKEGGVKSSEQRERGVGHGEDEDRHFRGKLERLSWAKGQRRGGRNSSAQGDTKR